MVKEYSKSEAEIMVRILVCIKQAIDVSQLKADAATRRLITVDAPKKISDFDKNALEEAVRIREKLGGEIITLTVGPEDAKSTMREALAIGADKAYIVSDPLFEDSDTLAASYILAEAVKKLGQFDLILTVLLNNEFGLLDFLTEEVSKVGEILSTETFVVYRNFNLKVPYVL